MLLRHTGLYSLARGVPGLINLLAIVAFSRILSPEEYGHYVLVVAGVGLAGAVVFQWLQVSLLRFLPSHRDKPGRLLSPILSGYLVIVGLTALGALVMAAIVESPLWRGLVAVGVVLLWTQAWFELNRNLLLSRLSPVRYGVVSGTKAVVALAVGVGLTLTGFGGLGALLGLLVGFVAAPLIFCFREWKGVRPRLFRLETHGYLLAYGLPLVANYVLVWVVASSDRLLLGWLLEVEAAGLYAVGYDLSQQFLGIVLLIVNLAAYPLAVHTLEAEGPEAARQQLRRNGSLLLAVAFPGTVGLAFLAPGIANAFVGVEFREAAAGLIPWIAGGTLLAGIKSYHFDLAFQLGRRTLGLVWVSLAAAGVNLGLNLLWIPRFGLMGAACATVVSYAVALAGSVLLGRFAFRVPWEWPTFFRIVTATIVMAVALHLGPRGEQAVIVVFQLFLGMSVYGLLAVGLDIAGLRGSVHGLLQRGWVFVISRLGLGSSSSG